MVPQLPTSKNYFSQGERTKLHAVLNKPLNVFKRSKLSHFLMSHGWARTITELNNSADIKRVVQWSEFKGADRGKTASPLIKGVYYGQMLEGRRDGYGYLYSTSTL